MGALTVERWEPSRPWGAVADELGDFYLRGYLEACGSAWGDAVELWAVVSGAEPRALLPLCPRHGRALIPPLAQYWGPRPLFAEGTTPARREAVWDTIVETLDDFLARRGLREVWMTLPPVVDDARPFLQRGWRVEPRYTYLVAARGPEGYDSATRRQLKKARGLGLEVSRTDDVGGLEALYRRAMRDGGLPEAPRALIRSLAEKGSIYEVRRSDGSLSAGLLLNRDAGVGYYTLAARDREGRGDGAPTLLVDAVLGELGDEGRTLDFVGANTPSICRFKRGFNGVLTGYLQARKVYRPAARLFSAVARRLGRG